MTKRALSLLVVTTIFCASLGCDVTIGPKIGEKIVLLKPGKPVQILQNKSLDCQTIEGEVRVKQDVGGWIAMPREHYDALLRAIPQLPPNKIQEPKQ